MEIFCNAAFDVGWMGLNPRYSVHLQSPFSTQQMSWQLLSWWQLNTWISFHDYDNISTCKHTSSCGKSAFFSIDWPNGTGMKMKSVIKNTHPVTTPKASGLKEIL
jgi:ATP-dependent helicase YprA (DUF1998 family)